MNQFKDKKIAIVINSLLCGGAERFASIISSEMVAKGLEVDIIVFNGSSEPYYQLDSRVKIIDLQRHNLWQIPLTLIKLASTIRKGNYDAVLSIMKHNALQLLISSFFIPKCPNLFTRECSYQSSEIVHNVRTKIIYKFMYRFLYKRLKGIFALTQAMKEDLVDNFKVDQEKISVIFNPAKVTDKDDQFKPSIHPFFEESDPVVLICSNLTIPKDYETLIKAMAILNRDQKVKLIALGEGYNRNKIQSQIDSFGLSEVVDLFGHYKSPDDFLNQADAFVLSSHYEGFPNVLVEAMSCGLPCVASDCLSGPSEIIENNQTGFLVPVKSPEIMAEKLGFIFDNPQLAAEMGQKARDFVERELNPAKIAQQYLDIIFKHKS